MHKLFREVRFSINPLGPQSAVGFNAYGSRPCGDGLSIYLRLGVELAGPLQPATGFVVNVSEIDQAVRRHVIGTFQDMIRDRFSHLKTVWFSELFDGLHAVAETLQGFFSQARVTRVDLALNPFRTLVYLREGEPVRLYSERFEFAAMHRLWNDAFSEAENIQKFGACANPNGHGHNYIVEVTVQIPDSVDRPGWIGEFERVVDERFLSIVDHKNLNFDVKAFSDLNPTVENICSFAWECLFPQLDEVSLKKITVWENDRTCCTYEGS